MKGLIFAQNSHRRLWGALLPILEGQVTVQANRYPLSQLFGEFTVGFFIGTF